MFNTKDAEHGSKTFHNFVLKNISINKKSLIYLQSQIEAGVVKLVDTPDLGSGAARRGGSSPFTRTD